MRGILVLFALVLANGSSTVDQGVSRPVTKVITLLKDMLKQLTKEAEEDEAVYDQLACWCETNDREKAAAISKAEADIKALRSKIEQLTADSARLGTEIENLKAEVAANKQALATATALREKQLKEFTAEEDSLMASIKALGEAVTVLKKHNAAAFLQMPSHAANIAATVETVMKRHSSLLMGVLTRSDKKHIAAFIQAPKDFFDAKPTFKQSYAPQSGQIFGILSQMKETFENDLSQAQKDENKAQKDFEALREEKLAQIQAGEEQIEKKTMEKANTDEANAQAKQDLEDTLNTLDADQKYLMNLKEKCSMTDSEWEERQKTRQLEMEAVSKALSILTSDEAHDTFTSTFNKQLTFVQTGSTSKARTQASVLLEKAATRLHLPRLATLAVRVRLDAFTRVKKAIDDMVAELLKEKEDEIKHKDFCNDEFNKNQLETEQKNREESDLTALIDRLEIKIAKLKKEIAELKDLIKLNQVQLKRAGENREKENHDFQITVTDQRATQTLLTAALDSLKGFYAKEALLQQEPAGPPPPPGFKAYKKSDAAGGVMSMIEQIISDAKAMEADAIKGELEAQDTYEALVKDVNNIIEASVKEIVNKEAIKGKTEQELVQAKKDLEAVQAELEALEKYNGELHTACDFVLKNFEIRQTARDEEIEALRQAKAILSGAKFEEFLQQ